MVRKANTSRRRCGFRKKYSSNRERYFSGRFYSATSNCSCKWCNGSEKGEQTSDGEEQEKSSEYHDGGYLSVALGNVLNNRYQIVRKLGWGVFSTVWLSWDLVENRFVALKIVKDLECDRIIAMGEVAMLARINSSGIDREIGKSRIVKLLDWFQLTGENGLHVCMVFEVMGKNLLSLVDYDRNTGVHLANVKRIVRQILEALSFLHEECRVVHTDIKPENVLLCVDEGYTREVALDAIERACSGRELTASMVCAMRGGSVRRVSPSPGSRYRLDRLRKILERAMTEEGVKISRGGGDGGRRRLSRARLSRRPCRVDIKLGDFGNAVPLDYDYKCKIQTEPYRAPEVILGAGFDCGADVWSVACLAFELATGRVLFEPTKSRKVSRAENHLACIMQTVGRIPYRLRTQARFGPRYFTKYGSLRRVGRVQKIGLKRILRDDCGLPPEDASSLASFLNCLLVIDPLKRPTALQCLKHPWLKTRPRARTYTRSLYSIS